MQSDDRCSPEDAAAGSPDDRSDEAEAVSSSDGAPAGAGASLENILDQYMEELAAGHEPDQQKYLSVHPDLAEALKGVFRTLDFVETTSRSLNAGRLEKGRFLGEYRIVREIGRGGMGVVYEAIQTSLGRRVALKVLPPAAILSGAAPQRFVREASTAGRLHHTNIVPVYAVGHIDDIRYYAMQYIDGQSLSDHVRALKDAGSRPNTDHLIEVARWGRQVAEALAYAHGQGVVHRDIKPSNLLLDVRGNVWVTDFGLARAHEHTTITMKGDVVGTTRYLAPEHAAGKSERFDERGDVYALGATMYELLAFQPAYDGDSRESVLNQIATNAPHSLRQINRSIPKDLETIVLHCMDREPASRYARAEDVAEDLRRFLAHEPILARRPSILIKANRFGRRHRVQLIWAVVVCVLLVLAGGLLNRMRVQEGMRLLDEAAAAILDEHDMARAQDLLSRAEFFRADQTRLWMYRGLIPLVNLDPKEAQPHLMRVLQSDPDNLEAQYAMVYAYLVAGDDVSAGRWLQRIGEQEPTTALGWLMKGYAVGSAVESLDCFNRALSLDANFMPAIEARARLRCDLLVINGDRSQLEPMLDDYDAWVIFRPNSARAYSHHASGWLHAVAYGKTQPDLGGSLDAWTQHCNEDFEQAIALRLPLDWEVYALQGVFLRYGNRLDEAVAAFEAADATHVSAVGRRHPGILHQLAVTLHADGRVAEAVAANDDAMDIWPESFIPVLHAAVLQAEAGRFDQVNASGRQVISLVEENWITLALCLSVLEGLGQPVQVDAQAALDRMDLAAAGGGRR
ncbi:MAG: protein kinase [Planctomycetes bacterium]|nr:protein kinase [Planctomycetota bacterium]